MHEPGERTIVGKHYAEGGEKQAQAVLDALAVQPGDRRSIFRPSSRAISPAIRRRQRWSRGCKASFLKTGGDLPSLYGC